jgi:Mg-chelatase subunit ChlD
MREQFTPILPSVVAEAPGAQVNLSVNGAIPVGGNFTNSLALSADQSSSFGNDTLVLGGANTFGSATVLNDVSLGTTLALTPSSAKAAEGGPALSPRERGNRRPAPGKSEGSPSSAGAGGGGANVYSLNVPGYVNTPPSAPAQAVTAEGKAISPAQKADTIANADSLRVYADSFGAYGPGTVVLPQTTPETSPAHEEKGGKEIRPRTLLETASAQRSKDLPTPPPGNVAESWDSATQKSPNVGWLGRVERGTPWQTVETTRTPAPTVAGGQEMAKLDESKVLEKARELEELQRFRQTLTMKIASENIETSFPKTMMVEIVDKAAPGQNRGLWERISGNAERSARIKVERDTVQVSGGYDPNFVQTEFEAMRSDTVLNQVVKDLDLNETWAKKKGPGGKLNSEETVRLLKKSLDLRSEPNSSVIDIGVKSDKPEEAAQIANAVATAYQRYRQEQRRELSLGGVKALEERLNGQERKIAKAQAELEGLQKEAEGKREAEADVARPKPAAPVPEPQPEVVTRENAFSTFSLNVSDVSFKLAGASLEKGVMPEPASVRSEEFINAFDYRDPEPSPGAPIGFAWERARYPFAHNRDLLRFSVKTAAQGRQAGRPLNIVLLLDNSGSMERADRVRIIKEALRVLASQLQAQDKLSVVTFARTARLWVDGVPGSQAAQVAEEVSGLTPQGGTNLEEAMNLAYLTALRHYLPNGINRVVLLTDGAANLGDVEPESLKQKVETNRKQGVALDCFGIGWEGYNDDLLEILSRHGDGRYGFINTPEEAATEFAGQLAGALHVAAADVKVQIEFNPSRVRAYRQIGYAKHQLTKEQFRDNTVDAAEIGAEESGNALYVIEVNPGGEGPLGVVRVRYKVPGTSDYREHEWTVPYAGAAVALESASPAMRLAATASAFSEWLAFSPYAGEVTPDRLLELMSGVPEVYGADARPKKLEWMIRQAKAVVGK